MISHSRGCDSRNVDYIQYSSYSFRGVIEYEKIVGAEFSKGLDYLVNECDVCELFVYLELNLIPALFILYLFGC